MATAKKAAKKSRPRSPREEVAGEEVAGQEGAGEEGRGQEGAGEEVGQEVGEEVRPRSRRRSRPRSPPRSRPRRLRPRRQPPRRRPRRLPRRPRPRRPPRRRRQEGGEESACQEGRQEGGACQEGGSVADAAPARCPRRRRRLRSARRLPGRSRRAASPDRRVCVCHQPGFGRAFLFGSPEGSGCRRSRARRRRASCRRRPPARARRRLSASSSWAARRFATCASAALCWSDSTSALSCPICWRACAVCCCEKSRPFSLFCRRCAGGHELPAVPPAAGRPGDDRSDEERDRDRDREHACLTNVHDSGLRCDFDELERTPVSLPANVRSST